MIKVLLEPTGVPKADRVLQGVIGIFEQAFPERVRGYYVRGSYASATSAEGSDLDMFVVFKNAFAEAGEAEKARSISHHCALLSPILLEILVVSERQLDREDNLVIALQLKFTGRPVYGMDIRERLPDLRPDAYVRAVVDTPYFSYTHPVLKRGSNQLSYPLGHADPDGDFFGFDRWLIPGPDGVDIPSTKLLVATVCWTATALIALQTGLYVRDKTECVELYRRHIGDRWTQLVNGVYDLCRNRWQYYVPAAEADRSQLRELCEQTLGFQNHYLARYRTYLLDELRSAVPQRQTLAVQRLAQIHYTGDTEVQRAVEAALEQLPPLNGSDGDG